MVGEMITCIRSAEGLTKGYVYFILGKKPTSEPLLYLIKLNNGMQKWCSITLFSTEIY